MTMTASSKSLFSPLLPTFFLKTLLAALFLVAAAPPTNLEAQAKGPEAQVKGAPKAVLIDGIAVLAGGRATNEAESMRILQSDLEFESALLLLRRDRPVPPNRIRDARIWLVAQRSAVLIRILANQARQFQETADTAASAAVKRVLVTRAGGKEAMSALLNRFGMKERDLDAWIENALLAATQLRYIRDQVDTPSDREIKAEMLTSGTADLSEEEKQRAYERAQQRIIEGRLENSFRTWIRELLKEGRIRIL